MWLCGVVVGDLIDEGPVGSHVRDVFWDWEVLNSFHMLWQGRYTNFSDSYSCPVNYILPKVELLWVENDAIVTYQLQILGYLVEGIFQTRGI